MLSSLFKKIFGSSNARYVKQLEPTVAKINALELDYQSLSDDQLKAKTTEFMQRVEKGESLDDLLPEAYAVVKNACRRLCGQSINYMDHEDTWNMIPYDVQLIGGTVMHRGGIAEMQTGEGKTLTASLPLYLNALSGRNVQLVTTNDFLAKRDSEWIGTIFRYLGLTVGCVQNSQSPDVRRAQYNCNITYGTNSEFGFDYLRDMGMASSKEELVQRDHFFVIVDEIDSILIDEARTPLIISGPVDQSTHRFDLLQRPVDKLFKKQLELCNKNIDSIISRLKTVEKGSDEYKDLVMESCIVKLGMPKNKKLMKLLENPEFRREFEKQELKFYSDSNRGLLQEVKEQLYFSIDERQNDADLSEKGRNALNPNDPEAYILPDVVNEMHATDLREDLDEAQKIDIKEEIQKNYEIKTEEIHNIAQLLRAYTVFERDIQYVVVEDKVVIVDEHTGYPMPGRRFSDGLHQALEAKEGVTIEKETQTLASITIQNYFRLYDKLAGMTGTAETEAGEFKEIYKLDVVSIPTNRPNKREDFNDRIFKTQEAKYKALIEEIIEQNKTGRPILVGTPTVEVSEVIAYLLSQKGIAHNVLNARRHMAEAEIIANAGQRSAITIATNMAGRGTDIKLGPGMAELGGLMVIGAARHDSRRIDRQLRGRCARQGDPGTTVFYISLEDDLMRLFGSDRITKILEMAGMGDDEQLEGGMLTKSIERAQKRVEGQHFSYRKRTLEYDDVMNHQRSIIYTLRKEILIGDNPREKIADILRNTLEDKIDEFNRGRAFDAEGFRAWLDKTFPIVLEEEKVDYNSQTPTDKIADAVYDAVMARYEEKAKSEDDENATRYLESYILLAAIDRLWKDHLHDMDQLRQSVQFAGIAQKDPLVEYKQQAFRMFGNLTKNIAEEVLSNMFRSTTSLMAFEQLLHELPQELLHEGDLDLEAMQAQFMASLNTPPSVSDFRPDFESNELDYGMEYDEPSEAPERKVTETIHREEPKVGRNDSCPCGSGKKFKKCCGASH